MKLLRLRDHRGVFRKNVRDYFFNFLDAGGYELYLVISRAASEPCAESGLTQIFTRAGSTTYLF